MGNYLSTDQESSAIRRKEKVSLVDMVEDGLGTASITLEAISKDTKKDEDIDPNDDATQELSGEQLMHLDISLRIKGGSLSQLESTHLILVVDSSGSMAGNPWKQVQQALLTIVGSSIKQDHFHTDLIVYHQRAEQIPIDRKNYEETIDQLRAGGLTNFVEAFDKIYEIISGSRDQYTHTVVVFLTDGRDTCNQSNQLNKVVPSLRQRITDLDEQVTFHVVGFSKDHDFDFLKKVAGTAGTVPGMFRYCEPGDDKTVLLKKLHELFDFIINSEKTCNINLEMLNKGSAFVTQTENQRTCTITGKVKVDETSKNVVISGETWVSLEPSSSLPEVNICVMVEDSEEGDGNISSIPCLIDKIERKIQNTAEEKSLWRLRILERNIDDLMNKTAQAVSSKADVSHLQTRVEKYQNMISKTKVFGNGISKLHRENVFVAMKDIQKSLDEVQSMLADYLRTGTDSLSLVARAHDMRYQAVFNKDRRQRVMDRRVSKNMKQASLAQKELANIVTDKEEIDNLSQDAKEFFYCILSQNSVSDVLLGDEKEDAIGFGLAVKRSEVVLDEPTLVRIQVISGTLISRTAMLDALEYRINISSHLKAHGGFTIKDSELGVTTIGLSREPINAWLPLYVTPSHWDRIKVLLKPSLGSFCTLDPLGYHYKQLDVLFTVLGSMVGQLSENNTGEHQLRLLFAVLRTCTACLLDFDMESQVRECLSNFLSSPSGRTKDIIPNLYTIVGYALALPLRIRQEIFKGEDSIRRFLLAIISEWLRRSAGPLYREESIAKQNGILKALIGNNATGQSEDIYDMQAADDRLIKLCLDSDVNEVEVVPYDPAADVTEPDIEMIHSERTDKAMEIWAEKKSGLSENIDKTKRKAYQKALIEVEKWLNVGKETEVGASNTNLSSTESEPEPEEADSKTEEIKQEECVETVRSSCTYVNETAIQVMAQLIKQITKSSYPHVSSFPGLIAFIRRWLSSQHDSSVLDMNSGIAPDSLIQEIKESVKQVYAELKDKQTEAEDAIADETSASEEAVTEETPLQSESQTSAEQDACDPGQVKEIDSDGDEDDDADDMNEYDIFDDEDGDLEYAQNMPNKKNNNDPRQCQICLPKLLKVVDGNCELVLSLRAMLCQAVRFHTNSKARSAIASGEMLDTAEDSASADFKSVLDKNKKHLEELAVNARISIWNQALWKRANYCMLHATSPLAFIGYLMNTHSSRNDGFSSLVDLLMTTVDSDTKPPCLKEKVHILLTGKYHECPVLDNGNQWLPEKKMAACFRKLLGDEIWVEFEAELRSSVQIHVYRESDIPNRHGHCNSNPYIPNVLRKRLGMALLPESKRGDRRRKRNR